MVLSTLASFDDLNRIATTLANGAEPEFLRFTLNQEECRRQWLQAVMECQRLQTKLTESSHALTELESKLEHARNLLDQEKKNRRMAEQERDTLDRQISLVRDMLEHNKINDETREKLAFLNNTTQRTYRPSCDNQGRGNPALDTINELESTGSILSELGYSQSEDDMDVSLLRTNKVRRRSGRPCMPEDMDFITPKRRRSSRNKRESIEMEVSNTHRVIATTTLTVAQEGPITASSKVEAVPPSKYGKIAVPPPSAPPLPLIESDGSEDSFWQRAGRRMGGAGEGGDCIPINPISNIGFPSSMNRMNTRNHVFCSKNIVTIRPEMCGPCGRKIKFAAKVMKCADCRAVCHPECKDDVPLPCVPMGTTPSKIMGCIADYTPLKPPMVPSIVIHCIKEIDKRGSSEVGIYRVPGSDKEVKGLKERFLRGKGAPDIAGTDVHVVSGALKDFLRSLKEPLVTHSQWPDFISACEKQDPNAVKAALYTAIAELPRPNRDTLAYLIMHLQRVASWEDCKMPVINLAKVFGPTIVGYSTEDMDAKKMVIETHLQQDVMTQLLNIPSDYWANFLNREPEPILADLRHTPSTGSLRDNKLGFFTATPRTARQLLGKRDKFFSTPQ